jgi:lysozyme family protein
MSLDAALAFTLKEEGGYVDDPDDSGGATNHGVTQDTYDHYRLNHGLQIKDVREIADHEVSDIYGSMYWLPAHCAELPPKLGICHFDWAVNHGVRGAIETLQTALYVTADGIFGAQTRAALEKEPEAETIKEYLDNRREWYRERVRHVPSQAKFLNGWLGRVDRLDKYLESL